MPIVDWQCAQGDPGVIVLPCASTVPIAPDDDSIDTNSIVVTGTGTINSFGPCSHRVTKRVQFEISAPVTLVHSSSLVLLSLANRTFSIRSFGIYQCGGDGNWIEIYFGQAGLAGTVKSRLTALEASVAALQGSVAALQGSVANHETRIAALEAAKR